jgi:hypothetical protein
MRLSIEKKEKSDGSCNFCNGKLVDNVRYLTYDYDYFYEVKKITRGGLQVSICNLCLSELIQRTEKNINPELLK